MGKVVRLLDHRKRAQNAARLVRVIELSESIVRLVDGVGREEMRQVRSGDRLSRELENQLYHTLQPGWSAEQINEIAGEPGVGRYGFVVQAKYDAKLGELAFFWRKR